MYVLIPQLGVTKKVRKMLKIGRDRFPLGAGLWVIWVGIGMNATLSSMGFHWAIGQCVSLFFFVLWGLYNADFSAVSIHLFFYIHVVFFVYVDMTLI